MRIYFTNFPYVLFYAAKPYLLQRKTYGFMAQKVWFRKLKRYVL